MPSVTPVVMVTSSARTTAPRTRWRYIDLYQLHVESLPPGQAGDVIATLDQLQQEGLISAYGWSTSELDCARLLASRSNGTALQHPLNVLQDAPEILALCAERDLASICNGPLAMGLLSGKFDADSRLPGDDVRGSGHAWVAYFANGRPRQEFLDKLAALREILTSGGRTLVQGALAWIWARDPRTVPIPGFKSLQQAEENALATQFGPLTPDQMREIDDLLAQLPARGGREVGTTRV